MCDLGDQDCATLWKVTHPKARVGHRCDCCRRTIVKGENYALTSSLYDGSWQSEKACAECATVINAFGEEHRFFPSASTFVEYLEECVIGEEESAWQLPLDAILAAMALAAPRVVTP